MFAVVLDTCVLWPNLQRDFLLSMAIESLYRPLWSERIVAELQFHEAHKRVERGEDQQTAEARAAYLTRQMNSHFEGALVENWEPYEGTFGLPDPDDEHVLAAAVVSGAAGIVTDNVRDFPRNKVPPHIEVLNAAEFAANTVASDPEVALRAVHAISHRSKNPPRSVDLLLDTLEKRYLMTEAVELLRGV